MTSFKTRMFRAARFCTLSFRPGVGKLSVKDKTVNVLGFLGCPISVTTAQHYHHNAKAATDNI